MKKKHILYSVFCILLFCFAATPPKFWHKLLWTPNAEWIGAYGAGDISWLAFNSYTNTQLLNGQGEVIAAIKKDYGLQLALIEKELAELKAVIEAMPDPNNILDLSNLEMGNPWGLSINGELMSSPVLSGDPNEGKE